MDFATKIKKYRKQNEWTQQEIATKLTVSRKTVSSWETGRSYPDVFMLVQLSDLYHVSLDDLLREDHEMIRNYQEEHVANTKRDRNFRLCYLINGIAYGYMLLRLAGLLPASGSPMKLLSGIISMLAIINIVLLLAYTHWEEFKRESRVSFMVSLIIILCLLVTISMFTALPSANINYVSGVITGRIVVDVLNALCLTGLITLYPQFKERRDQ